VAGTTLLVATRKGAWILEGDAARAKWAVEGPHLLGSQVHHLVLDPRDGRTLLLATRTGHLGPTVLRSSDMGKTWTEASRPPAFNKTPDGGRAVNHVFWLTPGHPSQPGVWWAGTSPHGVFRSEDGGDTWSGVDGFNEHPDRVTWTGGEKDQTPDGPKTHSVLVDPRDASHLMVGLSSGGIFESNDEGQTWSPLNSGVAMDFFPPKEDGTEHEYGHDPHCVVMHPLDSNRLYHQNHCGIYRLDRPDTRWSRIGDNMPTEVGDIGFGIVVHPRDLDTAWVFPMDGTSVWPRTSPGGKPALYRTRDGGQAWERQDGGLPAEQAWWTVKRQALATDQCDPLGLYFGTTSGEVWGSTDEGQSWRAIARHLPHVFAVETCQPAE
jgi:photosystem II stability/assembly factor-like uncharacterized protein